MGKSESPTARRYDVALSCVASQLGRTVLLLSIDNVLRVSNTLRLVNRELVSPLSKSSIDDAFR